MSERPPTSPWRLFKLGYLFLGLGLLGWILAQVDLAEVWQRVRQIGLEGFALVMALYALTFLTDVIGWQVTFRNIPLNLRWCGRLYLVRMLGEALNNVTPMASMGGEPLKATVLKEHFGVGLREAGASLVLAKTSNLLGLLLFLYCGFALLMVSPKLGGAYQGLAATGLVGLTMGALLFYLIQRHAISTRIGSALARTRIGRRLESVLHLIEDLDQRLLHFYTRSHGRFATSLALALANWLLGVVEVWFVMHLLGHPLSLTDAWILESMIQMVRAAVFFIPAGIGAQEGVFLVLTGALTGLPELGVAFSLIRRARELIWITLGLLAFWRYSGTPAQAPVPLQEP